MIEGVKDKTRIGVCLDTCHIWESGLDIINDYDNIIKDFDNHIGLEYLKVLHINDSKNIIGARKDRHENIGKGHIGLKTISKFVFDERFKNIPKILETPYIEKEAPYKKEIELILNSK
jgi:deoxyribonuclease-4